MCQTLFIVLQCAQSVVCLDNVAAFWNMKNVYFHQQGCFIPLPCVPLSEMKKIFFLYTGKCT